MISTNQLMGVAVFRATPEWICLANKAEDARGGPGQGIMAGHYSGLDGRLHFWNLAQERRPRRDGPLTAPHPRLGAVDGGSGSAIPRAVRKLNAR